MPSQSVTFPWAPRILWPNGARGVHWTRTKAARDKQKNDAAILIRAARIEPVKGDGKAAAKAVSGGGV